MPGVYRLTETMLLFFSDGKLSDSLSICNNTKHQARITIAWFNKTPHLWESITYHNYCDTVTYQHSKPVCGLTKMQPAWGCLNQRCDNFKSHGLLPLHCQTVYNHASFAISYVPARFLKFVHEHISMLFCVQHLPVSTQACSRLTASVSVKSRRNKDLGNFPRCVFYGND